MNLYHFKDCSFPLMSKRLLKLFVAAGVDNLDAFPAIIKSEVDGAVCEDYFVVNILGTIKCAELDKSTYLELAPGANMFDKLVIDSHEIKGALLFRLQEGKATIIMHSSVGEYIKPKIPEE